MSEEARFELRHGTQDQQVFDEVVVANQYQLPDKIQPDSLIIDIGANIGCFAVACLLRGAEAVICFEPSQSNFRQLIKNVSPWEGKAACFMAGVWRSDKEQEISISEGHGTAACACFPTEMGDYEEWRVNSIGLDQIVMESSDGGKRRVNLLKIDAEYSEYPILYSCTCLDLVDEIVGEAHEFNEKCVLKSDYYKHPSYDNSAGEMLRFLRDHGFSVTSHRESFDNQTNTLFFATRQN